MQSNNPLKAKPKRILGIDFGLKRMGIAISDETKILANSLTTFLAEQRSELTVAKLIKFIKDTETEKACEIEEIVVGLPLMMSGKSGFLADEVQHFVKLLQESTPIPIKTWDERLSTVQAERSLKEINLTRKRRSQIVDRVSAVIILQSYLDSKFYTL